MSDFASFHQPTESAIELAHIEGLLSSIRKSFHSSVLSILIFGALLATHSPAGLATWLGIRLLCSAGSLMALRRMVTATERPDRTITSLTVIMALSGTVWGLVPLLIQPAVPEWRAVVVLWLFGNQSVVTAVCAPSRRVFRAAMGSVTLVGAASILLYGDSFGVVLAGIVLLGGAYSFSIFDAIHQSANEAIEARLVASSLAAYLAEQQGQLESANETLTYLASRDELTGLLNRRSFVELLINDRKQLIGDGWLVYLDLDMFKPINDTYGHAAGDQVLQIAAKRWQDMMPTHGLLARTGGDEFAGWFPVSSSGEAQQLARGLNECLTSPIAIPDGPVVQVSCSIGVAEVAEGESFASAGAKADRLLYMVKEQGRNDVALSIRETLDSGVSEP